MTTSNDSTTPLKRCSNGDNCIHPMGCWQPATLEYFYNKCDKRYPEQLTPRCKECLKEKGRKSASEWRKSHPDRVRENNIRWDAENRDRRREYSRKWRAENRDRERETARRRRSLKPGVKKPSKWKVSNLDKHRQNQRFSEHRYQARKRALPATFTAEQWKNCLDWWNGVCAYCGAQQSFWNILEQDHCESMTLGGGYTADNILPSCRSCNASKNNKPAREWLMVQHGNNKRRVDKILARITAYFEWVKSQPTE